MSRIHEIEYEIGSGNLWADIGRPDAEEAFARAELMRKVTGIIRDRQLTDAQAAETLGTDARTVADLMSGRMSKFSLSRLISFMTTLGHDAES